MIPGFSGETPSGVAPNENPFLPLGWDWQPPWLEKQLEHAWLFCKLEMVCLLSFSSSAHWTQPFWDILGASVTLIHKHSRALPPASYHWLFDPGERKDKFLPSWELGSERDSPLVKSWWRLLYHFPYPNPHIPLNQMFPINHPPDPIHPVDLNKPL